MRDNHPYFLVRVLVANTTERTERGMRPKRRMEMVNRRPRLVDEYVQPVGVFQQFHQHRVNICQHPVVTGTGQYDEIEWPTVLRGLPVPSDKIVDVRPGAAVPVA